MAGVRSPTEAEDFSSSLCVQTGSGAHPASYIMGTGGSFPGGKARPGLDADHSPPSSAELKKEEELYLLLHKCASLELDGTTLPIYLFTGLKKIEVLKRNAELQFYQLFYMGFKGKCSLILREEHKLSYYCLQTQYSGK
jgi:hypothetical protein